MSTKKLVFFIPLLLQILTLSQTCAAIPTAVTYEFSGGRLGDNILSYMHAKWIAYQYDIPLLYRPFPYSDYFVLDVVEKPFLTQNLHEYQKTVYLGKGETVDINSILPTLYVVHYYPESEVERRTCPSCGFLDIDWKDQGFREILLSMLRPKNDVTLCEILKDRVTIAVHVRNGGGYDGVDPFKYQPLKIPPESFYLDQLKTICQIYPDEQLQVHIFTDHPDPAALAHRFKESLDLDRIEFTYRRQGNSHDHHVLDDWFSMLQFDCLIRSESHFSTVISLLKDYDVLIHPDNAIFVNGYPYIDRVKIEGKKINP